MDSSTPIESSATLQCIKEGNLAGSETTGSLKILDQFGDKILELFVNDWSVPENMALATNNSNEFFSTQITANRYSL